MAYDNTNNFDGKGQGPDGVFSKRIKAGKRRTYFFDVRETRSNDYFITITESKKRFNDDGYDRHKVFIYKEDFNKFIAALSETADYVKTELLPDFDFDSFNHDQEQDEDADQSNNVTVSSDNENHDNENHENFQTEESKSSVINDAVENDDNVESWKI